MDTPFEIPPAPGEWLAAADQPAPSPPNTTTQLSTVVLDNAPQPINAPLTALRAKLQPIAGDLLTDRAYWELLKRNASPRTFLEFVRFAFAADLEGRPGAANNTQVNIVAPFPRGPLDELPPHMRVE
jgi:hypothetical protein